MVKITKPFQFLYPVPEKIEGPLENCYICHDLLLKGRGALHCLELHPIGHGFYKLALEDGKIQVDIEFAYILDLTDNTDVLPALRSRPECMAIFQDMAEQHVKHIFLTL